MKYLPRKIYTSKVERRRSGSGHLGVPFDDLRAGKVLKRDGNRLDQWVLRQVTAKRKSFHTLVNCQISTTTIVGSEMGTTT